MIQVDKNSKVSGLPSGWFHRTRPTACLQVTGEDALTFLQGQFTQELRSVFPRAAAYGLWLNQKGKVLADSFVLRETAESVWIISFSASSQVIRERLEGYIIADDVTLTDMTTAWQGVVIGGADAALWLAGEAGELPKPCAFIASKGGFVFHGRRGAEPVWEWLLPVDAPLPAGLTTLVELSTDDLARLRIAAGIPSVPVDIGVGQLPNEGGLETTAISYTKGCYLGQEVMARLKAMGQVRRKLVRVRADGRVPPAVPCALLQGEKRVGELSSAVADGQGGFIGLALLSRLGLDPAGLLAPEPGGDAYIQIVDTP